MKAKPPFGLGIDAGGTRTRWAIAAGDGEIVAEGQVSGMTALHMMDARRERVAATLAQLARDVLAVARPDRVHAGVTGYGEGSERLADLVAAPLGLPASAVSLGSDIETACRDLFAPGEGYLVYAGTGSVATQSVPSAVTAEPKGITRSLCATVAAVRIDLRAASS